MQKGTSGRRAVSERSRKGTIARTSVTVPHAPFLTNEKPNSVFPSLFLGSDKALVSLPICDPDRGSFAVRRRYSRRMAPDVVALELPAAASALARLEAVADEARDYATHAKAPNTLKAYRCDWADFSTWCATHQRQALPAEPQTVALYLTDLVGTHQRRVSTLYRRLSAISQAHQAGGYVTPTTDTLVRTVFQGIRRAHGTAPDAKTAAVTANVRRMVEVCPSTLLAC